MYCLTNVSLTTTIRQETHGLIAETLPETKVVLEGAADLCAHLDAQPAIRLSYPQILGLRDLQTLLRDELLRDIVQRSEFSLEAAERLAPRFVPTAVYSDALSILAREHFSVLLGPPEMGKTATALMIGLARLTTGWQIIDCRSPDDLFRAYDRDAQQLFLADDAFGSTEYRPDIAMNWAAVLHTVIDKLNRNHELLWTSRPAPLREGLRQLHLQGSAGSFPRPHQVEVNASRLTVPEKAQMLYRHAKSADLAAPAAKFVREPTRQIVLNQHFTPLRISRFVREQLPTILKSTSVGQRDRLLDEAIDTELQTPTNSMLTSLGALDEEHRAVLISLLNGGSASLQLTDVEDSAQRFFGRPFGSSVKSLLQDVDDHFVHIGTSER